jgi:phage tail sheath protein FI
MAEKIVSPGVFTRENDLSFLPQGISQIGAAIVGPTEKGPAFVPTLITSQAEYEQIFGAPKDYYTGYTVQNYLRDAGSVTVVRVAGTDGHTTLAGSANGTKALVITDGNTNDHVFAILENTETATATTVAMGGDDVGATIDLVVAGTTYVVGVNSDSAASIDKVLGNTPLATKAKYANLWFDLTQLTSSANFLYSSLAASTTRVENLPAQVFSSDSENAYSFASTPWIQSQKFDGDNRYDLLKVHTIAAGESENTRFKVQISNIKSSLSGSYGTFTLTLRDFNDSDKRKVILETYNNLTLDPASPNFIARRIGDRYTTIDSVGKITENGDYSNKSKYIRVEVKTEGQYPIESIPFGFAAYTIPVNFGSTGYGDNFPIIRFTSASAWSTGSYSSGVEFGDSNSVSAKNNKNYFKAIPASAGVGSNVGFALDNANLVSGISAAANGTSASAAYTTDSSIIAMRNFTLAFQGGYSGIDPTTDILKGTDITETNTQGFDCSTSTSKGTKAYVKALNALSNPDEIDINLLVTPGIVRSLHPYVTTKAMDLCEAREDVFYIADFVGADGTIADVVEQASLVDSNYTATYYPWVKTIDTITNKIVAVPPSTLLVGTYAQNDRLGAEWFAPAGLNRGGIQGAVQVLNRLTQSERDSLYEGKVNPIAAFPGQGISAFGQKTLQESASALDRINVRRLLINLKKFVASTSRFLVFEQNTGQTRAKFLNTVNPYLESVQQRQGLYAFRVVMDETNNTPDVIDRNILQGSVFLQPAKTAEFIVIDFNILPTGATFSV